MNDLIKINRNVETNEEIVSVVFMTGSNYKIGVTGDSLLAIVNDVTKRLLK